MRKELHHFDETQIQYILITTTYLSENLLKIIGLFASYYVCDDSQVFACNPSQRKRVAEVLRNSNNGFFVFLTALA